MSSKKARLIRTDNFNRVQFYNVYTSIRTVKCNKLIKYSSTTIKKVNYLNSNNKSFSYSSIFKCFKTISSKTSEKGLTNAYALYLHKFFYNTSNNNYFNNYDFYNIRKYVSCLQGLYLNATFLPLQRISQNIYQRQSWYFDNIYKHKFRHFYEKEDENKLLYRKYNLYTTTNILQVTNFLWKTV